MDYITEHLVDIFLVLTNAGLILVIMAQIAADWHSDNNLVKIIQILATRKTKAISPVPRGHVGQHRKH